jgi:hypothetical protein
MTCRSSPLGILFAIVILIPVFIICLGRAALGKGVGYAGSTDRTRSRGSVEKIRSSAGLDLCLNLRQKIFGGYK